MPDAFLDEPGPMLSRRDPDRVAGPARAVLLMLHGGTQHSRDPVTAGSASLRRMMFLRNALAPHLLDAGYAVWLLKFAVRGWNGGAQDADPSPVPDARWALGQVPETYAGRPVVLLGHSMGARTAAHVADDPSVIGMVGLAPWLQPGDPYRTLAGKHLVAGHGLRDRITSAALTRSYVERAGQVAVSAEFVPLGLAGHYMLYRPGRWRRFALRHSLALLGRAQTR